MHYERDPNRFEVYLETRKRRMLAGTLEYDEKQKTYQFIYELPYLRSKSAIAVGPDLPMSRQRHEHPDGKIFPTFLDRIPSRENPAYPEYCQSQGISPDETNLIVLLTTIGRRGPSSFIYEPIFVAVGNVAKDLRKFRKELELSRWDVAMVFDIPELTIYKIETGKSTDPNITRLLHHYLNFPDIALAQLERTGKRVHRHTRTRVYRYFKAML